MFGKTNDFGNFCKARHFCGTIVLIPKSSFIIIGIRLYILALGVKDI